MQIKNQSLQKREQRFAEISNKAYQRSYERKDGSRVRQLMKLVAHHYRNNPDALKNYKSFIGYDGYYESKSSRIAGIASSAYHYLTGDFSFIQSESLGGLGAIITESPEGLEFSHEQLKFARISGTALRNSKNSKSTLWLAEISGTALRNSKNSESALWLAEISGNALENSQNSDYALRCSINSGNSLKGSKNYGYSLICSINSENSLEFSTNHDCALLCTINLGNALHGSVNLNGALFASRNTENALQDSQLPNYESDMKEYLNKRLNKISFKLIKDHLTACLHIDYCEWFTEFLNNGGWSWVVQSKLEDLLEKEARGTYSNPEFFKEGGTRYLFTVEWGPAKKKRIVKVDKPISALTSPRARRHVEERGCNTANELQTIARLEHPGIVQLLDYFPEDVTKNYGLSGAITVEEFCDGYQSLEEVVAQGGPLLGPEIGRLLKKATAIFGYLNNIGFFHRDLKPSNFLITRLIDRDSGFIGDIDVKITDWANACRTDKPQQKYMPTAGGHFVTDPLLMGPFTDEVSIYSWRSEAYAFISTMMFAARGKHIFEYDPDNKTAIAVDTSENILDQYGKLDPKKHEEVLSQAIKSLDIDKRSHLDRAAKMALTIDKGKRRLSKEDFFATTEGPLEGFRSLMQSYDYTRRLIEAEDREHPKQ